MKKVSNDKNATDVKPVNEGNINLEGYPHYPARDDIYNQSKKKENTEGGQIEKTYDANGVEMNNEKDFDDDVSGDDLDIPGSELDDQQEEIGNEDEENNYYSIGGDRHDDLEEHNRE